MYLNLRVYFLSFLIATTIVSPAVAVETQSTILSIDFDDVLSKNLKPTWTDFVWFGRLIFVKPSVVFLLYNIRNLVRECVELIEDIHGASNKINAIKMKLISEGYGDYSAYETEIINAVLKPVPLDEMVTAIKKAKANGYILIGSTNQDYEVYQVYRQKMKRAGIDLDQLFDAIVVTRTSHTKPRNPSRDGYYKMENNLYMITDPQVYKPKEEYFEVIKIIADSLYKEKNPESKKSIHIVHTDDRKENADAADKLPGMKGIHFDLNADHASDLTPEQLSSTIAAWKKKVSKTQGIHLS